jgi:hypothetical protein
MRQMRKYRYFFCHICPICHITRKHWGFDRFYTQNTPKIHLGIFCTLAAGVCKNVVANTQNVFGATFAGSPKASKNDEQNLSNVIPKRNTLL